MRTNETEEMKRVKITRTALTIIHCYDIFHLMHNLIKFFCYSERTRGKWITSNEWIFHDNIFFGSDLTTSNVAINNENLNSIRLLTICYQFNILIYYTSFYGFSSLTTINLLKT